MICKNCGANIKNKETYCPSCGMELMVPYSKSLKEKYIAGEYQDHPKNSVVHNRRNKTEQKQELRHVEDTDEYEQYHGNEEYQKQGSGSSALLAIILFLVVALLFGFVLGIILFSGALHQIPIFSNITL
jgi:hypothetical protein